jgi:hypothetical protein
LSEKCKFWAEKGSYFLLVRETIEIALEGSDVVPIMVV